MLLGILTLLAGLIALMPIVAAFWKSKPVNWNIDKLAPDDPVWCEHCKRQVYKKELFCRQCGFPVRVTPWPEGKKLIVLDEKYDPVHSETLIVWASEQWRFPRVSRVPDAWSHTESEEMKLDMLKRSRLPNSGAITITHSEYDLPSNSYLLEWVRAGTKESGLSRIPNHHYEQLNAVDRQGVDELILHYQVKDGTYYANELGQATKVKQC